ncbi:NAD+ kinase [Salana multivorans]|uniref:NAD kinase n=1 Tax=Salana multivorans TaxID=120377 RepID=A0A3N2D1W8_9MICO|nr:NAD kinase [Salana multivorans]ROR93780.1 NAD+ kinase [Salana multivorans]
MTASTPPRRVLLVSHVHERARVVRDEFTELLRARGIEIVGEAELERDRDGGVLLPGGVEIAVVLGGDGTILRAAELVRGHDVPVLGVNLGHVGFLAELDEGDVRDAVRQIDERAYDVERRMTVDVRVVEPDGTVRLGWAMNEASVEKDAVARMVELAIGVDGRELESFGCDGVVLATPTGSTAYGFSAGGPVVWPDVEALLLVPLNAHALFARPLVVGPSSVLEVELLQRNRGGATMWCDGRRTIHLAPGARVEVRRGAQPVILARLRPGPFTARLVRKFALPVTGWRGEDDT